MSRTARPEARWAIASVVLALLSALCLWLAWAEVRVALAERSPGQGDTAVGGGLSAWNADRHLADFRALDRPGEASALARLDRAIGLRPREPTAWTERAVARLDAGDLGGLVDADRALELGPHQSHTFVRLWPRWLFHWSAIGEDRQQRALDLAQQMSRRFPDWIVEVADRYGRLSEVCGRVDFRARAVEACRRFGWNPRQPL